jgi:hypothetical protein
VPLIAFMPGGRSAELRPNGTMSQCFSYLDEMMGGADGDEKEP